jgi:hypothetical protein
LGLNGEVPDHSTFSKNRHGRFCDSDLLRRIFETVLQRCIDKGLVDGEGFAVDTSLIQADASDRTRVQGATGLPPDAAGRAVEEYLAVLDDAAFGAATEVTPKFIAPADPATRWTAAHRGPAVLPPRPLSLRWPMRPSSNQRAISAAFLSLTPNHCSTGGRQRVGRICVLMPVIRRAVAAVTFWLFRNKPLIRLTFAAPRNSIR